MVRRTKEQALATRDLILDTAERVFLQRGVSRTSLHEIAQAAGLTRGAIYWHFQNKAELFDAMMLRVTLPLECGLERGGAADAGAPLALVRRRVAEALRQTVRDPQLRRVFEIAAHRTEYVDELSSVRERRIHMRDAWLGDLERSLLAAQRLGQLRSEVDCRVAALGAHALIDGLLHNWLLDPAAFDLESVGLDTLDAFLHGLSADRVAAQAVPTPMAAPTRAVVPRGTHATSDHSKSDHAPSDHSKSDHAKTDHAKSDRASSGDATSDHSTRGTAARRAAQVQRLQP